MGQYLREKLKKLRESRGWTQADLAKRLNKAVSTVSGMHMQFRWMCLQAFHPYLTFQQMNSYDWMRQKYYLFLD